MAEMKAIVVEHSNRGSVEKLIHGTTYVLCRIESSISI